MLYRLPNGNWVDPALVRGVAYLPADLPDRYYKGQPSIPDRVVVDWGKNGGLGLRTEIVYFPSLPEDADSKDLIRPCIVRALMARDKIAADCNRLAQEAVNAAVQAATQKAAAEGPEARAGSADRPEVRPEAH